MIRRMVAGRASLQGESDGDVRKMVELCLGKMCCQMRTCGSGRLKVGDLMITNIDVFENLLRGDREGCLCGVC